VVRTESRVRHQPTPRATSCVTEAVR
jgi:hypothetical protein